MVEIKKIYKKIEKNPFTVDFESLRTVLSRHFNKIDRITLDFPEFKNIGKQQKFALKLLYYALTEDIKLYFKNIKTEKESFQMNINQTLIFYAKYLYFNSIKNKKNKLLFEKKFIDFIINVNNLIFSLKSKKQLFIKQKIRELCVYE